MLLVGTQHRESFSCREEMNFDGREFFSSCSPRSATASLDTPAVSKSGTSSLNGHARASDDVITISESSKPHRFGSFQDFTRSTIMSINLVLVRPSVSAVKFGTTR